MLAEYRGLHLCCLSPPPTPPGLQKVTEMLRCGEGRGMHRNGQLCWVEAEQDSELAPVSQDTLLSPCHAASPLSDAGPREAGLMQA